MATTFSHATHYCVWVVYLLLLLSAHICEKPHIQTSQKFWRMLPVALSFSDNDAVRYVLSVVWMTSYFHILAKYRYRLLVNGTQ